MGASGDVIYFGRTLAPVPYGPARTLVEYPLPAVGVVALPGCWLSPRLGPVPVVLLVILLAVDGAFTVMLVGRGRPAAMTGCACGWGGAAARRADARPVRPGRGGPGRRSPAGAGESAWAASAAIAVATALKLWPVLLPPSWRRSGGGSVPRAVPGVGLVIAGACLAVAGWDRLFSPLLYQADRGLQVESLFAFPVMVGWLFHP